MRTLLVLLILVIPGLAAAQTASLPATIPIFPLEEAVLFPEATRPLLIFEPRYRAMVADALEGARIIGMATLRPGFEKDYEGRPPIFAIGCAGEIVTSELLPDGRYMIILKALTKFRVLSENQSRAYRLARVEAIPEPLPAADLAPLSAARERLATRMFEVLPPGVDLPDPSLPDAEYVNFTAQYLSMPAVERQALLEQRSTLLRARALLALLERQ